MTINTAGENVAIGLKSSFQVGNTSGSGAQSNKRAAAYIKENLEGVAAGPPKILEGEAVIDF